MNTIISAFMLVLLATSSVAAEDWRSAISPEHRVAMLELYTSEGCSSCPPADRWLSSLQQSGISQNKIIPLAFHVTYWDYIGWRDSFGDKKYDERQRVLGRANKLNTIYTPQFVLAGKDFRRYKQFVEDVRRLNGEKAQVDLTLGLKQDSKSGIDIRLQANTENSPVDDVALFVAVVENELMTAVEDGENEGETLHHDYVVRQLYGPMFVGRPKTAASMKKNLKIEPDWNTNNMNVVGFAQNMHNGEILQAVSLDLLP